MDSHSGLDATHDKGSDAPAGSVMMGLP